MTIEEAQSIMNQLQELEFPRSMAKARQISLLKAGAIPTMSKLFLATGQNSRRNAGRRVVDTEILLREAQSKSRDSDRYATAVSRMNYLHNRCRRANKITDNDLLHTLGDSLISIFEVVNKDEWRKLTDAEKCAAGVFHKILGDDMKIPYDVLPSHNEGWRDGLHFANELTEWVVQYENEVARPSEATNHYTLAADMNDIMMQSLNLESPGTVLSTALLAYRNVRKLYLRHLSLPRPTSSAVRLVDDAVNSQSKLYNFQRKVLQPWYMKPTFWSTWGPAALLLRSLGAKAPGSQGDRYYPQGYDLMTIGPEPQKGKGIDEMTSDIETIKGRGVATCPFSHAKAGYI
ncbi:hypothetical protein GQ607_004287 [Colletotrichum asianum]|uniref:Mycophenolic acid synthesis protein B n=1 Tax=Colletotrichum asianum TaxID=702518 RepID=A0A8H3WME9_9PEZI|nr:hypothetical protein GQ607_004287 [Colletotrichum asianum]